MEEKNLQLKQFSDFNGEMIFVIGLLLVKVKIYCTAKILARVKVAMQYYSIY
jgi:hypothetical protein